jgi:hypothetical protein
VPELDYEPEATFWESDFGEPNPVVVYPTVRKDLLKEQIETKIEEYREGGSPYDEAVIMGLEVALQILEES